MVLKLALGVVGIYGCYGGYSIFQEKINRIPYDDEWWTFTLPLLAVQCLTNSVVAFGTLVSWSRAELGANGKPTGSVPFTAVASSAIPYFFAMACSNAALGYVDYPTQVLAKSVKPVAVMLVGLLLGSASHSARRWQSVAMLTSGIAVFFLSASSKKATDAHSGEPWERTKGVALLAGSLFLDGVYGAGQDRLKKNYAPSSVRMMLYMNLWSVIFLWPLAIFTGDAASALAFIGRHPEIIPHIAGFALLSALGQNFIYYTVFEFGSLICSIITTTRKFFTILASVILFAHPLERNQWIGVGMVFLGLAYDMYGSWKESKGKASSSSSSSSKKTD